MQREGNQAVTRVIYALRLTFGRAQTHRIYTQDERHELPPRLAETDWGGALNESVERRTVPDEPTPLE